MIWDEVAAVDMEVSVMHQISDSRSVGITWQDIWRMEVSVMHQIWLLVSAYITCILYSDVHRVMHQIWVSAAYHGICS